MENSLFGDHYRASEVLEDTIIAEQSIFIRH